MILASLDSVMQKARAIGMVTLGEMITKLEAMPKDSVVKLDFNECGPDRVRSYRGYYEDLAVGWKPIGTDVSVAEVLQYCKSVVGRQTTGYKGGTYLVHPCCPVWAAQWGTLGRPIVGIESRARVGQPIIAWIVTKEDS